MLAAVLYDLIPCFSAGSRVSPGYLGAEIKLACYGTFYFWKCLHGNWIAVRPLSTSAISAMPLNYPYGG